MESLTRNEKHKRAMHMFLKCNRLHHAKAESRVSALGLHRSQHGMLLTVNFNSNISQKELAKRMEISPAAVTVTLKKLEAQGFIERFQLESDSRVNNITVTEKGKNIIQQTGVIFDEIDAKTFEGFSDEELDILLGYLSRISQNLGGSCCCHNNESTNEE